MIAEEISNSQNSFRGRDKTLPRNLAPVRYTACCQRREA